MEHIVIGLLVAHLLAVVGAFIFFHWRKRRSRANGEHFKPLGGWFELPVMTDSDRTKHMHEADGELVNEMEVPPLEAVAGSLNLIHLSHEDIPDLSMSTPADLVLGTVELLEQILLCLPTRSVLSSQGVNRQWRSIIDSSSLLQRHLFFLSTTKETPEPLEAPGLNVGRDRPELLELPKPVLNELLAHHFRLGPLNNPDPDNDGGYLPMVSYRRDDVAVSQDQEAEPSWQRMFVTQPPARRVEVQVNGKGVPEGYAVWIENEEGVRMGEISAKLENTRKILHGATWRGKSMGWYFEL
ncbi:hypothetical protein K490DRAFT_60891 [Saccharata proteae CBS 121410]|uniref:F-box domain-containing protein n=1 Tax=Saccharata proteae CBS 121410 TaxID=1314787 RepID=A0A9P4LYC4_9PEZI|nr:hypothetical protein K490DRAFT_60891 [Saccharata proteae CBS 121410]